jgi:hypothetical protein
MNLFKYLIIAASILGLTSVAGAAGNSGSAGKPLTTNPSYGDTANPDAASMDDHTDSALNRRQPSSKQLGHRTSLNTSTEDTTNPHGDRGSGGSSNSNDTATGTTR